MDCTRYGKQQNIHSKQKKHWANTIFRIFIPTIVIFVLFVLNDVMYWNAVKSITGSGGRHPVATPVNRIPKGPVWKNTI